MRKNGSVRGGVAQTSLRIPDGGLPVFGAEVTIVVFGGRCRSAVGAIVSTSKNISSRSIDEVYRLVDEGKRAAAKALAINLAEAHPCDAKAWSLKAYIHALDKDYSRAIEDMTRSITLKPESTEYFTRGRYHFYLGENVNAKVDFDEALRTDNYGDSSYQEEVYFWRAEAYLRLGDIPSAIGDLQKVKSGTRAWTFKLRSKEDILRDCGREPGRNTSDNKS